MLIRLRLLQRLNGKEVMRGKHRHATLPAYCWVALDLVAADVGAVAERGPTKGSATWRALIRLIAQNAATVHVDGCSVFVYRLPGDSEEQTKIVQLTAEQWIAFDAICARFQCPSWRHMLRSIADHSVTVRRQWPDQPVRSAFIRR